MSDSVWPHRRQPPGSPVPGILQARTLEWVAISFSNAWKWKVKAKSLSRVRLLATPWTAAYQAPPSMGFSRQEYWSGVPLPSLKESGILSVNVNIFWLSTTCSTLILELRVYKRKEYEDNFTNKKGKRWGRRKMKTECYPEKAKEREFK